MHLEKSNYKYLNKKAKIKPKASKNSLVKQLQFFQILLIFSHLF